MKAFTYLPKDIGWKTWPDGLLQLSGTTPTRDPAEADVFICPVALHRFQIASSLDVFPHIGRYPEKHVFFHCSDDETRYERPCLFIRCNLHEEILASDQNSIAWPWPVDDFSECVEVPQDGFKYDVSFHGQVRSSEARQRVPNACELNEKISSDIQQYPNFTGDIFYTPEGTRRAGEYRRSLKESRIALCPEAILGHFPYRFWEAMSAGRVPLLVGSGFVFPFADDIPYQDFSLLVSRENIDSVPDVVLQFLEDHTDDWIITKGRQARFYWEKYLNRAHWHSTMADAVAKKL